MNSVCKIDANGNKRWYLNGKLHREDGPAIISYDKKEYWYLNGKLHQEDDIPLNLFLAYFKWELNKQKNNC